MDKNYKRLKVYAFFLTIAFVLATLGFVVLFFHGDYDTKILVKLGLKERTVETNWAVVGWNNTMEKLDYDADIVFFGDSITRGSDFREFFPKERIVNLGYPGDSLEGMKKRIISVSSVNPEKVFVLGGINCLSDANIQSCLNTYAELLDDLKADMPNTVFYIQSVLPVSKSKELSVCHNTNIRQFNQGIKTLAEERNMIYIDLYSLYEVSGEMNPDLTRDGVHICPEAYELWANAIKQYIE